MKKIILTLLFIVSICCFIACDDKEEGYEVTFKAEDYVTTKYVKKGNKVSEPKEPTKDGFVFVGWYEDNEYTKTYDFNNVIESDITVYGYFIDENQASKKVKFISENFLQTTYVREGTKVDAPQEPTKEGFIFIGWYEDSEYTKVYDFNNVVKSDITLYGKFSDKTYLISKEDKDVFDIDEKEYYIFFVKESCPYCKKIKPDVNKYMAKVTELPEFKDKPNVYMIDLKTSSYKSIICRSYNNKNNDGQGTDGKFYVDDALKWDDLYIASFPSLIKVEEIDGVKRAKYVAQGATKVLNYIESLLK